MPGPKKIYHDKQLFEQAARKVHGDKYDYSKFALFNSTTPGTVICNCCHHEFQVKPWDHLYGGKKRLGYGCPICANKQRSQTLFKDQEWFMNEVRIRREDKGEYYDYSKVIYRGAHENIELGCPIHGPFLQSADSHLRGSGCPACGHDIAGGYHKDSWESYFQKIRQDRFDKGEYYDYSKVIYKGCCEPIEIICPKHGSFWQTPSVHRMGCGCPHCKSSKLEEQTRIILEELGVRYEYEKRFKWLGLQSIDFYLPDYKIAIECQGIQHYQDVPYSYFKTRTLNETKQADARKRSKCNYYGIKLRTIHYNEKDIKQRIISILK